MRFVTLVFLISFLCFASVAQEQTDALRRVTIDSSWGGLGKPATARLAIGREGHKFELRGKYLDAGLLTSLIASLDRPGLETPQAANLGVTSAWLDQNAEAAGQKAMWHAYKNGAPNQKALYRTSFTNLATVEGILPLLFNTSRTDDYPEVVVKLIFDNGVEWSASSHAWDNFMLPWEVEANGNRFTTYNADISRAVAALMPLKTLNRERLVGTGFMGDLADAVLRQIDSQWKLLDVENRVGQELAVLRSRYEVKSAEINPFHHVEYGQPWNRKGAPQEENLHVVVWHQGLPENFSDGVVLRYEGGQVFGIDSLFRHVQDYEKLALSVPWLTSYLAAHPQEQVMLRYVHESSLNQRAMSMFSADMRAADKGDLATEVMAMGDKVALLVAGHDDYWLVLPDRRMILWRFSGVNGLLKFRPTDFATHECTDYRGVTGGCVGAVVTPEGILVK